MEIKQLEVFASVAKNLSFSKTAEELYISQPTVSAYISALEKALGVQLLVRNTKEVSLTKAGRELLDYTKKILSLREQAIRSVCGEDSTVKGFIDIIASTIPAQYLLPDIIASFQKKWPNIIFRVDQADSRCVLQEMGGFRYDFGMVGTAVGDGRFVSIPAYNDELVLIVPNDTPMSDGEIRDNFSEFILSTPFVMRESGSGTRAEIEALLSKLSVDSRKLSIPAYFPDGLSILASVSKGTGVSLISGIAASMYAGAGLLRLVEMQNPLFRRQIHLLYNRELWLSPVQRAFTDEVNSFYQR